MQQPCDPPSSAIGAQVSHAVVGTLRRRVTDAGTRARKLEDQAKKTGARLWVGLKRHPYLGIAGAGVVGVAAASAIGVGELVVGIAVAYGAYNVLIRGESPEEVARMLARSLEVA